MKAITLSLTVGLVFGLAKPGYTWGGKKGGTWRATPPAPVWTPPTDYNQQSNTAQTESARTTVCVQPASEDQVVHDLLEVAHKAKVDIKITDLTGEVGMAYQRNSGGGFNTCPRAYLLADCIEKIRNSIRNKSFGEVYLPELGIKVVLQQWTS